MKCDFCNSGIFFKWTGNSGLSGWRCVNKCFSSSIIETVEIPVYFLIEAEKKPENKIRKTQGKKK